MRQFLSEQTFRLRHPGEKWLSDEISLTLDRHSLHVLRSVVSTQRKATISEFENLKAMGAKDELDPIICDIREEEFLLETIDFALGIDLPEGYRDNRKRVTYKVGERVKIIRQPAYGYPEASAEGVIAKILDEAIVSSVRGMRNIGVEFDAAQHPGEYSFRGEIYYNTGKVMYWFCPEEIANVITDQSEPQIEP
jgi:hypothetical protein